MIAVLVIPKRNISIKVPEEIYSTHCPKTSTGKVLAIRANPAKPKKAMVRFPVRERKLASRVIFRKARFIQWFLRLLPGIKLQADEILEDPAQPGTLPGEVTQDGFNRDQINPVQQDDRFPG